MRINIWTHVYSQLGNPQAVRYWDEFGVHLAEALKCVVLAYDPEAIVLGGSVSKAYDFFKDSMRNALQIFPFPESVRRLKIFRSENENIVLLGAAEMVTAYIRSLVKAS